MTAWHFDAQELKDYRFDWRYMVRSSLCLLSSSSSTRQLSASSLCKVRGLTIDKQRGNMLKIDRHKYVKIAYHGFRQLSREQRLSTYANSDVRTALQHTEQVMPTKVKL